MNSSIAISLFDWLIFIREIGCLMLRNKNPIVLFFFNYKHDFSGIQHN